MTDTSLTAPNFSEREFRVGNAMSKAIAVLSRNVLPFGIVAGIASLPTVLLFNTVTIWLATPAPVIGMIGAVVLFGALSAGAPGAGPRPAKPHADRPRRGQGGVPGGVRGGRVGRLPKEKADEKCSAGVSVDDHATRQHPGTRDPGDRCHPAGDADDPDHSCARAQSGRLWFVAGLAPPGR
jgi:hypothetical protein